MRETELIEFKKSTAQLREAVISISSMLNKSGKGNVYFGIKDDGSVCGQDVGKKTTADISHEIRTYLKPLPDVSISVEEKEGKDIICISASGNDTPYSAYGRYYIRIDDADIPMDSRQLWAFFTSKDMTYSKWETTPTKFGVDYINEDQLIQYIREANEIGRLNYVYRNVSDCLTRLNLIDDNGLLNNAGYYLFGNDGPVLLKEVVYPGEDRREFIDLKLFRGNILECINEGMKYIQNNIHHHARIDGLQRFEIPEIPVRAIREIVVNSFTHCHYQTGDSNEISITRSKVKIYNPGGILHDTDPKDFASGKVGSKIRNPLIATVLFKNGYIDAFGTGFDRTFKECADYGVNYTYHNDEFGFSFVFNRKKSSDKQPEINRNEDVSELDRQIIDAVTDNSYVTISELSLMFGKSEPTIYRHINYLVSIGMIQRIGSRKNGYWKIL